MLSACAVQGVGMAAPEKRGMGEHKAGELDLTEEGVYTIVKATMSGGIPKETFGCVCMSNDGRYLGCVMTPGTADEKGSMTYRFKVLSMERQRSVKTIECPVSTEEEHRVVALEMSEGSRYLVSAHCYNTTEGIGGDVRVWDLQTGDLRHTLATEGGGAFILHLSNDGRYIATVGCESAKEGGTSVQVWDLEEGTLVQTIECVSLDAYSKRDDDLHALPIMAVGLTADGSTVITGSRDGSVRLWDMTSGQFKLKIGQRKRMSHTEFGVYALDVPTDGRWMVCGGVMVEHDHPDDNTGWHHLYYLNLDMGARLVSVRSQSEGKIKGVSVSDDGRVCVAWRQEGNHWSSRVHRLSKVPGITGWGSEATLGIQGAVEDEIALSDTTINSVTRVARAGRPSQYYVAYSTDETIRLSVFSQTPSGGGK